MSRLENAKIRLDAAIERLENAVERRHAPGDIGTTEAVRQAREDYAALKTVVDTVRAGIDDAIAKLEATLDN